MSISCFTEYFIEKLDFKEMLKMVKIELLIKKHILNEMEFVNCNMTALSIFKKMEENNLKVVGLRNDNDELINIFTEFDIEYWLECEKAIHLNNDALSFLSKIRPFNMYQDERPNSITTDGSILKIDCSFSIYDAIQTMRHWKLHRIIV